MFARNQRRTAFPLLVITLILLSVVCTPTTGYASANAGAAYIALGDSIEFGLGAISEPGYVYQLHSELPGYLGVDSVDLYNLAQPGATVRDIKQQQLKPAVATIENYEGDKVVILWGGGGNDLLQFILSPEAATCRQEVSCLNRLNALLKEMEQTVDHTIRDLRLAAGPDATILVRTQYNSLAKSGYPIVQRTQLADIALEGFPGSPLERGLNDRLRSIAGRYGAQIVDLYLPFRSVPDLLISNDFIHPNDAGHAKILELAIDALNAN